MSLKRRRFSQHLNVSKRRRTTSPTLPLDVWHVVASHLPPPSLAILACTSRELANIAETKLHNSLWRAVFDIPPPRDVHALPKIINLLNTAPSLRSKQLSHQLRLASEDVAHTPYPYSCFTVDQAAAFLAVDREVLVSRYAPARVKAARRAGKRGCGLAFQPFPPDVPARTEVPTRVFGVREVLRAAYASHGGLAECLRFVEGAVTRDRSRFERAQQAERVVCAIVKEKRVEVREVEYALNASAEVVEFRRGLWKVGCDEYAGMVRQMIDVHVGLGSCYRCLLICDGNARLKAKRMIGKILRSKNSFVVGDVVRALEGNLWWARSKSNVQKMEEMSRGMPKIRV